MTTRQVLLGWAAVLWGVCAEAQTNLINFDSVPVSPGPIGDFYLSVGVRFYAGNGEFGTSTDILTNSNGPVSAWVYPGSSISPPNVMVPQPGGNNDIYVYFYDLSGRRTVADFVGIQNDAQAIPYDVFIEAFDICGGFLGLSPASGPGGSGTVYAPGSIYVVRIFAAAGEGDYIGVDNFTYSMADTVLRLEVQGTNAVLNWPASITSAAVETSSSLSPGESWSLLTNAPTQAGVRCYVTNAVAGAALFYRLRIYCH